MGKVTGAPLYVKVLIGALVQTGLRSGDDDRMQRFVPVEALFKGRHFDGQIIILCVSGTRASN